LKLGIKKKKNKKQRNAYIKKVLPEKKWVFWRRY